MELTPYDKIVQLKAHIESRIMAIQIPGLNIKVSIFREGDLNNLNFSVMLTVDNKIMIGQMIVWVRGPADVNAINLSTGEILFDYSVYISDFDNLDFHLAKVFAVFNDVT